MTGWVLGEREYPEITQKEEGLSAGAGTGGWGREVRGARLPGHHWGAGWYQWFPWAALSKMEPHGIFCNDVSSKNKGEGPLLVLRASLPSKPETLKAVVLLLSQRGEEAVF